MATATDDRLRLLIERVERLEEEKKGIADDIRDTYAEAKAVGYDGDKGAARELIHGLPMEEWKARFQREATPEQLARMEASLARNQGT